MRKGNYLKVLTLFYLSASFTSCDAIAGVFNAGMGVGIFTVLAILVVIVFVIMKIRKK